MQGQGSQELSDRAEGARGRLGRAEGLLVRTPLSPDCHLRDSQGKNLSGLWLAQAQGHSLFTPRSRLSGWSQPFTD